MDRFESSAIVIVRNAARLTARHLEPLQLLMLGIFPILPGQISLRHIANRNG
jgi:hypothetical protein